jgi:hypothetical protein
VKVRTFVLLVCLFGFVHAIPAVAQVTPETQETGPAKPYKALFGGNNTPQADHTFDLNVTLAGAYDDDVYGDLLGGSDPLRPQVGGFSTMLLAGADYNWRGRRVQFGATASSALRHFAETDEFQNVSQTAGLGFSAELGQRTNLMLNQTIAYSPSYLYGLFPSVVQPGPGEVPTAAPDYSAYDTDSVSYGTTARVSHSPTQRGTLSATVDMLRTDFRSETANRRDLNSYGVQGQYSQNVSRNATLRFGYRYRTGDFGYVIGRSANEHSLEFGVDYTRPLSPTRKATFGFTVAPAAVDAPLFADGLGEFDRQYRVLADMRAGYQFSRTWQVRGTYHRGLEYVPGLRTPVYADGFTAVVDGLMGRRWDFLASAAFSDGESAVIQRATTFKTYTANTRVRYAFTSMLAAYAEYLYYYYDFRGSAELPLGAASVLERNGVRFGLTLWVPVKGR